MADSPTRTHTQQPSYLPEAQGIDCSPDLLLNPLLPSMYLFSVFSTLFKPIVAAKKIIVFKWI